MTALAVLGGLVVLLVLILWLAKPRSASARAPWEDD